MCYSFIMKVSGFLLLRQFVGNVSYFRRGINPVAEHFLRWEPSNKNSQSSIAMRGHRNAANRISSTDGGGGEDGKMNGNHHHINQQGINYNKNKSSNNMNDDSNNGPGSSDSKKGGSSSRSDTIPAVWPPEFVIGLTKKEKKEDFMPIDVSKLPQRPKKRAKGIQRNLNLVSPAAWLYDLTL